MLIDGTAWILLLLWAVTGADAELPTSRKGWYAVTGIIIIGVLTVVVMAMMWPDGVGQFH
ncbi:hypothetical protein WK72_28410 [Burkholderia ubonensis]|nr:hypothetical protein WI84_14445 [Burkholderia ubonensis]KVG24086.1 hypothetical protein WJ29_08010 [Burkholderia ubonensis]KVT72202.1 hypothetical protein WK58_02620 [Burkholderia ubonensis]KVU79776.1 hypothetical protein WK72_28410 [Burkholderia ubonensis]KVW31913.1 hypothetical protein WK93_06045 [Burkholderia ubonensis]